MRVLNYLGLVLILLYGCLTPPEVKQLSVKQAEHFDSAIHAVSIEESKKHGADREGASMGNLQNTFSLIFSKFFNISNITVT